MDPSRIVELIVLLGGSSVIGVIVNALISRRKIVSEAGKTGADAAQVLSEASVAMLVPMEKEVTRLNIKLAEAQTKVDTLDTQLRQTNTELRRTKESMRECTEAMEKMNSQLQYYYGRYGPPTGQHRIVS